MARIETSWKKGEVIQGNVTGAEQDEAGRYVRVTRPPSGEEMFLPLGRAQDEIPVGAPVRVIPFTHHYPSGGSLTRYAVRRS